MNLQKQLQELIKAGVITEEVAGKITAYYEAKEHKSPNMLFVVFGVIGSLLIGLGLILIIAHNWDILSRLTKTILAFVPLVAGQVIAGYTLLKKTDNKTWRESSATFLFFAIGATMALISQIYHLSGSLTAFLFTWLLLAVPLVYLLRSSMASLLYIAGISYYVSQAGYNYYEKSGGNYYWLLLLLILPFYYWLYKNKPDSNALRFHHWFLPLSVLLALGSFAGKYDDIMFVAFISQLGFYYLIGQTDYFTKQKLVNNSYKIIGSLGTVGILLVASFKWFWVGLGHENIRTKSLFSSPEFIVSVLLTIFAGVLFFYSIKSKFLKQIKPVSLVFMIFPLIFLVGIYYPVVATILINLVLFVISIYTIKEGIDQKHLITLNYGLLILTVLIISRFLDINMSFVLRGVLFILIGIGFFVVNYRMLKKEKK